MNPAVTELAGTAAADGAGEGSGRKLSSTDEEDEEEDEDEEEGRWLAAGGMGGGCSREWEKGKGTITNGWEEKGWESPALSLSPTLISTPMPSMSSRMLLPNMPAPSSSPAWP